MTLKLLRQVPQCVIRRVRKIAKSDYLVRHVCLSVRLFARKNSALTGRIS